MECCGKQGAGCNANVRQCHPWVAQHLPQRFNGPVPRALDVWSLNVGHDGGHGRRHTRVVDRPKDSLVDGGQRKANRM